jgi:hypothetical protein
VNHLVLPRCTGHCTQSSTSWLSPPSCPFLSLSFHMFFVFPSWYSTTPLHISPTVVKGTSKLMGSSVYPLLHLCTLSTYPPHLSSSISSSPCLDRPQPVCLLASPALLVRHAVERRDGPAHEHLPRSQQRDELADGSLPVVHGSRPSAHERLPRVPS